MKRIAIYSAAALLLAAPQFALAETFQADAPAHFLVPVQPELLPKAGDATKVAAASDPFAPSAALAGDDLKTVRAGEGAQPIYAAVSDQTLAAENHGNSVNASIVNSGAVNFGPNSLQGFSGLGNFVLNTGNNNNLQGSLSVTVFMAPAVH